MPSLIKALKDRVDEDTDYEQQMDYYKKNYPSVCDMEFLQQNMFVIPVSFSKEHKNMLAHAKELMKDQEWTGCHSFQVWQINYCT